MQIFLINLARSPDRLAFMKSQLGDRFERIDAVLGAAVLNVWRRSSHRRMR